MTKKKPTPHQRKGGNPHDMAVSQRVRLERMRAGVTQESVAKALGVTFQQVQKYEKGSNRIAPSRLIAMAHLFDIPVSAFFGKDVPGGNGTDEVELSLVDTPRRVRILELLKGINDTRIEAHICDLLETIAGGR